mmetsp:Transcript_9540/g.29720  ORF Transcript_9540/g.29720 Transcript_9540/m.29720 type:complete len:211 (-) Transcript_9540:2427-3059(-)
MSSPRSRSVSWCRSRPSAPRPRKTSPRTTANADWNSPMRSRARTTCSWTTNARSRSSSAFFLRDRRAAQVPQPTKPSATKQPITMPATARRLLKRRLARRAPSSSEWRAGGGSSVTRTASFTSVNAASQATTTCSTTSVRVLARSASTFIVTVTERLASYRAKVLGSKIASSFREGSSVAAAASGRSSAGVTQTAPRVGVAPKRTAYVAS